MEMAKLSQVFMEMVYKGEHQREIEAGVTMRIRGVDPEGILD